VSSRAKNDHNTRCTAMKSEGRFQHAPLDTSRGMLGANAGNVPCCGFSCELLVLLSPALHDQLSKPMLILSAPRRNRLSHGVRDRQPRI